jgi:phosphorylase kinase alpha/beta subunit
MFIFCRTPFQKRQLDGALNRVPKDFYDRVWKILEKTPGGIKVSGYQLPQQPTQSDMTMYEMNFSLLVEQMLSKIVEPAYRQLVVEVRYKHFYIENLYSKTCE